MPNIAAVLKEEIARVARREVRTETDKLKKAATQYRAQITELRRHLSELQREVTRLSKAGGQSKSSVQKVDVSKIRWSPSRFKALRERLELSADKFGKLFSVSGQTIYNWESGVRPSNEHLNIIAHARKLSKRQAHAIVDAN